MRHLFICELVARGAFFSREVLSRIVFDSRGAKLAGKTVTRGSALTARENEVLRYVASGMAKKEIAHAMGISVKTVERHCANPMGKLDIHGRVELARYAIRKDIA